MYIKTPNSTLFVHYGFELNIPKFGFGINAANGKLERTDVLKISDIESEQKWRRTPLPADWHKRRKKEIAKQEIEEDYVDPELERFRQQEWRRRLCGVWLWINGDTIYITGLHYFYLNWWQIDIGYPHYRDPDRKFFYVLNYCLEDQKCGGLLEATKRRQGKTYRGACFLYEGISRMVNSEGGIQSKTAPDARDVVFKKALVSPFKKLPDFFIPIFDTSKGMSPTSELKFAHATKKGARAMEDLDKPELNSLIDWASSEKFAYDGRKKQRIFEDEVGKCFGEGTPIRMFDGSVKNVEAIRNGEVVMGDDSTPRVVSGITRGSETMYRITPKSGKAWECNASHILSLKWCWRGRTFMGKGFGETVNISVTDFLSLNNTQQKHLVLWRQGWDHEPVRHTLDPYFMGLWLGDGHSHDSKFTTDDPEILSYATQYASTMGLLIRKQTKFDYKISSERGGKKGSNKILTGLQDFNLIANKHIPDEYMVDSMENRLQLLAGLIDTDGYLTLKNGKPSNYEIVQKRKLLAEQIRDVAESCGFKANIVSKIATMRRKDGSIYRCEVYRVTIFGDLFRIPCRVQRKKAGRFEFHNNRRNPLRTGFKIENIGDGDYFGFAVDGNHLFQLKDGTIVHNTEEEDVYERHLVVRYCLETDGEWTGFKLASTTVEDMTSGGAEFKMLWDESDPDKRDENGHTATGMYRYMTPAYETLYFDDYGMPEQDRAKIYYMNRRAGLARNPRALSSEIRKNPFNEIEMFRIDGDKCIFNSENLNEQSDFLSWHKELVERGNFEWKNGERFTEVIWEKNKFGRFMMPVAFNMKQPNAVQKVNGKFVPMNNHHFRGGCDPFKYNKVKDKRRSDCAGFVGQMYDAADPNNPFNDAFVCRYRFRAATTGLSNEDILKMAWYFGCQFLFERNVNHWEAYFIEANCESFLMKLHGESEYGIYSDGHGNMIQSICDYLEDMIEHHYKKIYFLPTVLEYLEFDPGETTKFDETIGSGVCRLAMKKKKYRPPGSVGRDVTDFIRIRKVS